MVPASHALVSHMVFCCISNTICSPEMLLKNVFMIFYKYSYIQPISIRTLQLFFIINDSESDY